MSHNLSGAPWVTSSGGSHYAEFERKADEAAAPIRADLKKSQAQVSGLQNDLQDAYEQAESWKNAYNELGQKVVECQMQNSHLHGALAKANDQAESWRNACLEEGKQAINLKFALKESHAKDIADLDAQVSALKADLQKILPAFREYEEAFAQMRVFAQACGKVLNRLSPDARAEVLEQGLRAYSQDASRKLNWAEKPLESENFAKLSKGFAQQLRGWQEQIKGGGGKTVALDERLEHT
jgi:chromosome segregation ATPase